MNKSFNQVIENVDISYVPMYGIYVLNNDVTPFEFVVVFLVRAFNISEVEAEKIAVSAHKNGSECCKIYPKDIAECVFERIKSMLVKEAYNLEFELKEM